MISGPILEELLLSQKAVYRNISVGGAGLVQVRVPEGKTWIITKIHILPFINVITPDSAFADATTFEQEILGQNFSNILSSPSLTSASPVSIAISSASFSVEPKPCISSYLYPSIFYLSLIPLSLSSMLRHTPLD